MRHFLLSINRSNAVKLLQLRRQPSMHTEDLFINESCKTHVVKQLCTVSPDIHTSILPYTLVIEAIYLSDLSAFMVASNQENSIRVSKLKVRESPYL
jgi:hypothetical protein